MNRRRLLAAAPAALTGGFGVAASVRPESPDAEILGICERFGVIDAEWRRLVRACYTVADEERLEPRIEALEAEQRAMIRRLEDLRATTFEGIEARAGVVATFAADDMLEEAFDALHRLGGWYGELAHATLRDLIAVGAARRAAA